VVWVVDGMPEFEDSGVVKSYKGDLFLFGDEGMAVVNKEGRVVGKLDFKQQARSGSVDERGVVVDTVDATWVYSMDVVTQTNVLGYVLLGSLGVMAVFGVLHEMDAFHDEAHSESGGKKTRARDLTEREMKVSQKKKTNA